MTVEKIKDGIEIQELIASTSKAISSLSKILPREKRDKKKYEDGIYNFNISEHSDGSGEHGNLSRYYGNERLLKIIIDELNLQLSEFEKLFDEL